MVETISRRLETTNKLDNEVQNNTGNSNVGVIDERSHEIPEISSSLEIQQQIKTQEAKTQ